MADDEGATGPVGARRAASDTAARTASDAAATTASGTRSAGFGRGSRVVVGVGLVAGIGLRVAIHGTALGRTDSDEVLSALMARHIGDSGYPAFVWGQHYGGTLQLAPVWLSTTVLGQNLLGLRLPTLVLAVVNAVLLWRIVRRRRPEPEARLAGLLLWIGPAASTWFGIHEQLFYPPMFTLGLLLVLLAHRLVDARLDDRSSPTTTLALAGLVVGLGWWTGPNIAVFAVAAAVWLVLERRRQGDRARPLFGAGGVLPGTGIAAAAVLALVGAAPWILDAITSDWGPLRASSGFPRFGNPLTRAGYLVGEALPGTLGARDVLSHEWAWGPVGVVVALGLAGVIGLGWWRSARDRDWPAIGFVAFAVALVAIPWTPDDPNLRYTFIAAPFLAALVARGVAPRGQTTTDVETTFVPSDAGRSSPSTARSASSASRSITPVRSVAVLLVATLLTGVSLYRLHDLSEHGGTVYRVGNVPDLDQVIAVLDSDGVTRVWGDYWVAYRLTFETDEQVIASPAGGLVRHPPYDRDVRAAPRSAWVVLKGPQADAYLRAMAGLGVPYQRFDTDHFVVAVPDRPVLPEELPDAARAAPGTPKPTL